jgi:signal peptidase II
MIIGGALGNILDRIPDGYVTDFLHLKVNEFSFFIFNPADALISYWSNYLNFFRII